MDEHDWNHRYQAGEPRAGAPKRPGSRTVVFYLSIGAALALIVLAAYLRTGGGTEPDAAPSASPTPGRSSPPPAIAGPRPPDVAPELMKGSDQAPVTMVVFGDYQCPYCAAFTEDQQPRLEEEYVESGQLRLVWRDYPYRGPASERAAAAARAASRQDAFWRYHDALYADPGAWTPQAASDEPFITIAADLGLDTGRFRQDLNSTGIRKSVQADLDFALDLGVPGTPAFLIDGEAFFGAQPIAEFEKRIDKARGADG